MLARPNQADNIFKLMDAIASNLRIQGQALRNCWSDQEGNKIDLTEHEHLKPNLMAENSTLTLNIDGSVHGNTHKNEKLGFVCQRRKGGDEKGLSSTTW